MWVVLVRFIRSTCEIIDQEVNIEKKTEEEARLVFFFLSELVSRMT